MIQLLKEENSGDRNVSYHKKTRVNLENNGRRKVTIHQSPLLWMLGPRDFTRKTMESWASSFYFHNYNSVSSSTKGPNPHTFLHHCVSLSLSPFFFCFFWLWDLKDRSKAEHQMDGARRRWWPWLLGHVDTALLDAK